MDIRTDAQATFFAGLMDFVVHPESPTTPIIDATYQNATSGMLNAFCDLGIRLYHAMIAATETGQKRCASKLVNVTKAASCCNPG
jgi:hypothetical protein